MLARLNRSQWLRLIFSAFQKNAEGHPKMSTVRGIDLEQHFI
jgi:hypothetical protein